MIEKLAIQGFKCFRQFRIEGLRRVNIRCFDLAHPLAERFAAWLEKVCAAEAQ